MVGSRLGAEPEEIRQAARHTLFKERCMEVVKSLLKLPLEDQPDDFNELYKLISARISKRSDRHPLVRGLP